jgi:hypothetical protein
MHRKMQLCVLSHPKTTKVRELSGRAFIASAVKGVLQVLWQLLGARFPVDDSGQAENQEAACW